MLLELKGLGYALIQYNDKKVQLIECGSRSLTAPGSNYATIELECLTIAWAVDKCKYFLAGNPKFQPGQKCDSTITVRDAGLFKVKSNSAGETIIHT